VDAGQNANTIQGTIGKGASGVEEVAQRVKEKLQAPDHLNEKEKMIFEKLDGALEPTKLEVCHIILGWKRRQGRVRTWEFVQAHWGERLWDWMCWPWFCKQVQDISGGCGSMYGIEVVSERFRGLSMLKQQRLVNEVLGEEIKGWHGVQLKTRAP
jgi:acid stress-induced BolA-like protein IbaG/YrbA